MTRSAEGPAAGWIAAGAALFAAAELAAGLLIGRWFEWGRAEALLFFAFRPWLLLAAALLAARFAWRGRALFYAAALLAAGLSQALLALGMGASDPWSGMLRGLLAGALLAATIDLALVIGARLNGRVGRSIAAGLIVLVMIVPGSMRPFERVALGTTAPRPQAERPPLLVMTGLPIVWGERGPFDPHSPPAQAWHALQREFDVRLLDHLGRGALPRGGLMLLAQPRALEPAEFAAFDAWVRAGGRALILVDPMLAWPSELPIGDIRRPSPVALLDPLLAHWGLRLLTPAEAGLVPALLEQDGALRRLHLGAPGRFETTGGPCAVGPEWLAACRIGRGRALLVADADLLHDTLWVGPTEAGAERHARRADNMLVMAHWLDRLAGIERARADRPVRWADPQASRTRALLLALLPILLLAAAAAWLRFRRR